MYWSVFFLISLSLNLVYLFYFILCYTHTQFSSKYQSLFIGKFKCFYISLKVFRDGQMNIYTALYLDLPQKGGEESFVTWK